MAHGQRKRENGHLPDDDRRYRVRGIRRNPIDIGKLSKALLGLAQAEAERQAQAEQAARDTKAAITPDSEAQSGGTLDA